MSKLFEDLEEKPTKKKRDGYHAGNGKYTDPKTARAEQSEKEVKRLTNVSEYYKRQCERLQREVLEEKEKNKQLQAIINRETNIQRKELSIA